MIDLYKDAYRDSFNIELEKQQNKEKQDLFKALVIAVTKEREAIAAQKIRLQQEEIRLQQAKIKLIEEKSQRKTDFLMNFAHEIRLPLTIIRNQADMIIAEAKNMNFKNAEPLKDQVKELLVMVENILIHKRIEGGDIIFNHDMIVNISNVVLLKLKLFKGNLAEKEITLALSVEPGLYIKIASDALNHILNNILDNAIKFNKEKGSISVAIKAEKSSVLLIVQDTGIGISPEDLKHITEPFFQAPGKNKANKGIGAGLSITRNILSAINASIDFKIRAII